MITDEQLNEVNKYIRSNFGNAMGTRHIKHIINVSNNCLSTDQLKQICEAKGLSVVEWVEFDEKNGDIPDLYTPACSQRGQAVERVLRQPNRFDYRKSEFRDKNGAAIDYRVTHYCELPQRNESK